MHTTKRFFFPLISLIFLAFFTACFPDQAISQTTLILVRHAEKASSPANDPHLTEFGKKRALLVRDMLSEEKISAIYTTPYNRTRETVQPLADATNIEIIEYDPRRDSGEFLEDVIANNEGGTVVISGHSNTIPMMLNELAGNASYEQFDESEYDNMFVATTSSLGKASVLHLTIRPEE